MCGGADDGYSNGCYKTISLGDNKGIIMGALGVRTVLSGIKSSIVMDSCSEMELFEIYARPMSVLDTDILYRRESNPKRCGYSTKFKK